MRRHGATVVGSDLRNVVFRTIYMSRNAEYQLQARMLGLAPPLYPGEIDMAGALHRQPNVVSRAWEYWCSRLDKAGGTPPRPGKAARGARMAAKGSASRAKSKTKKKIKAKSKANTKTKTRTKAQTKAGRR